MKLDDLKELESKATPAPWKAGAGCSDEDEWFAYGPEHDPADHPEIEDTSDTGPLHKMAMDDAALMTAMRNLAPHFIAHMEAAKDLGIKFNACQATYTPEGDETDATAEASEAIHEAFMKMAEAQNAFAAAIRAL